MSFGNTWVEIDLDKSHTTLIVGKNGSGKTSAILESISFALFNKPFRNITKPQLTNSITRKACMVELDFIATGYRFKIRRGLKPAIFEIYKEGELVTPTADIRDYQTALEKYILKINHKTFCQVVMLGSAVFVPFMALPTPQRRAVIEDLLDLEIFSIMNVLLKSRVQETDKNLETLKLQKTSLEQRLALMQEHLAKLQTSRREIIETKIQQIHTNEVSLTQVELEKASTDDAIQELLETVMHESAVQHRHQELINLNHILVLKTQQLAKDIKFFSDNETCPTCHQNIDTDFKIQTVVEKHKQQQEIVGGLSELEHEMQKIKKQQNDIRDVHTQIQEYHSETKALNAKIQNFKSIIKLLHSEIKILEQQSDFVDISKVDEVSNELSVNDRELSAASTDRLTMGYAISILKDSGIKAKIIKTFIPVINQLINKYLAALDFFVEFTLNESFEEKLLSRFRDEFSYESFSEGEKMRLNIAILFAWRSLAKLRGSIDCNLVILDELLDSSLDNDGLDDVLKLLQNITSDENIFIISHKTDQMADKFSRIIHFEKYRNFSRMAA